MYIKLTTSQGRKYLQIVQAYRDPESGKPKQRYLANLGRADQLADADVDGIIDGLLKHTSRPPLAELSAGISSNNTAFSPALELGDVWAITQLWQQLKFAQSIARAVRQRRFAVSIEQLLRVMVINRLSDPRSKLGLLRWLDTVYLPGIDREAVTHQNLLRAMDALIEHKEALEERLAGLLLPLVDDEMEVVFYDITTIDVQAGGEDPLRRYGKSKDHGGIACQYAVGVVQTADGLPISHEVFPGKVSEPGTLKGVVDRLCKRFPLRRLVLVADRGLLSMDNLDTLQGLKLADGSPVEFILAVPARRYSKMTEVITKLHPKLVRRCRESGQEAILETCIEQGRLVLAHDAEQARDTRLKRRLALREAMRLALALEDKLVDQRLGFPRQGRTLTENGAIVRFKQFLADAHLSRFFKVDTDCGRFNWQLDRKAYKTAWQRDGKLVLITNVAKQRMDAKAVIARYKSLADIERGFRVLKSDIAIAPVYHWLPERIRAHTFICFLALVLHRIMRQRLQHAKADITPGRLLETLKQVQYHRVRLANGQLLEGVSSMTKKQGELFEHLGLPKPTNQRLKTGL